VTPSQETSAPHRSTDHPRREDSLPDRTESSSPSQRRTGLPRVTLVLGGARSGKSRHAEALIEETAPEAIYLATAEPRDDEMAERIRRHRARRGERWVTIEEPLALTGRLREAGGGAKPILVDCLTLWLANLMEAGRGIDGEIAGLLELLPRLPAPLVLVANEVGLGIVPENALARAFRDQAGRLNQAVAARAERVVFMAAGLPLLLKDKS
jgi:adenosylcobinamide kinase/adenosylcobinamide-phosphate guanylyltransferase